MYTFESIVSYSKVDKNGNLPLFGILNFLQDCTNFQSESIGMGVAHMASTGKAWVLVSYKIRIKEKLKLGDRVRIGTAAASFSSIYGNRKFCIERLNGDKLVEADSMWVLMDIESRRPLRIDDEEKKGYVIESDANDLKAQRKLKFSDDITKVGEYKVLKSFIDNNGHMNNADYLRVAAEFIPEDFEYHEIDIVYNKELLEGDTMVAYIHQDEDAVEITFEDTENIALAKIKLNK